MAIPSRARRIARDRVAPPASEPILGRGQWRSIAFAGGLEALCTLGVFMWARKARSLDEARNLAFSVLVFSELLRAFSARDPDRPFWKIGVFSNLRLFFIVVISRLVQLAIHHLPATQELFGIEVLSRVDCVLSVFVGAIPVTVLELSKLARSRARSKRTGRPRDITHDSPGKLLRP